MTLPSDASTSRAPCFFIPHGGGPMPLLNDSGHATLTTFLQTVARSYLSPRPKAILLVTAHWETRRPTVSTVVANSLLYDYGGFPPEAYDVAFPARGSPEVAARVVQVLEEAGFEPGTDGERGWDHGVFVPLKVMLEDYEVPVVSVSVLKSQSGEEHYRMGRALGRLRDEGVAVVGSGMSFHNFGVFRRGFSLPAGAGASFGLDFDAALVDAVSTADATARGKKFAAWEKMPGAFDAHPEGEADHLMPLLVVAGAGGDVAGKKVLDWNAWGTKQSAFTF
ncbi:hypothetical protein HKX48_005222 [Thoreauomyces humboldtii]|nr:hypothetical protein HKX48_005222 [Thoreauomyces humboldtii]